MANDTLSLEEQYAKLSQKYKLPDFNNLNEDFDLGKIDDESPFLLRNVRKALMEKITSALSFTEMLLTPVNAPRIYLAYIKSMTEQDKKTLEEIFSTLGQLSLRTLPLDVSSREKDEAAMIVDISNTWGSLKPSLRGLVVKISQPAENVARKERSYFG